jgi:hypothetical protein
VLEEPECQAHYIIAKREHQQDAPLVDETTSHDRKVYKAFNEKEKLINL